MTKKDISEYGIGYYDLMRRGTLDWVLVVIGVIAGLVATIGVLWFITATLFSLT